MLAVTKALESGPLAGASPDITLPKVHRKDGRGPAILFADVSKSMQLHERLGDQAARVLIDQLLAMAERAITAHRGRVIKYIGDEVLAILPNADAAVCAARDLLVEVNQCEEQGGLKPAMHVGLHSGTFVERAPEGSEISSTVPPVGAATASSLVPSPSTSPTASSDEPKPSPESGAASPKRKTPSTPEWTRTARAGSPGTPRTSSRTASPSRSSRAAAALPRACPGESPSSA